MLLIESVLYM